MTQLTPENLGQAIRQRRALLGMTQSELARTLGWDKSQLCRLELGQAAPSWNSLIELGEAIGPLEELITLTRAIGQSR
jgi:transcriptional regulator with XRE-family HTH domain